MVETSGLPDPTSARTPAEFVALLRRLKAGTDLTYRQLQDRAAASGDLLPHSSLATMLNRSTLPREEPLAAFLRACGVGPDGIEAWLAVRRRIAAGAGHQPPAAQEPDTPAQSTSPKPRRRMLLAGVAALAVVAFAAIAALVWERVAEHGTPAPSPSAQNVAVALPTGPIRIRVVSTNLCLTERQNNDSGHIYQAPCGAAFPIMSLDPRGKGVYRITTNHPRFGPGCMGVAGKKTEHETDISDGFCDTGQAEEYQMEPVTTPLAGYRIRPVHSNLCLGIVDNATQAWATVRQLTCDPTARGQVFQFDPR